MKTAWKPPAPVECPACHKTSGVAIVYGMPSTEVMELVDEGRVALGGCMVMDEQPNRSCRECHAEWKSAGRATKRQRTPGRNSPLS